MNGDRMFAGRISDCEKPRLELGQHIEIVKSLGQRSRRAAQDANLAGSSRREDMAV